MTVLSRERLELATSTACYLKFPLQAFEAMIHELTEFSGPDKNHLTRIIKEDLMKEAAQTSDNITLKSLASFQKKLEAITGFGAAAMLHSAGRAAATKLKVKSISDCGDVLANIGFVVKNIDMSESQIVVCVDSLGFDYLFLGLLEGLVSSVIKKEISGKQTEPEVFTIFTQ